ncbi:MAG: NUDIX hydrolase [Saprospiraceae bacterium]
MKNWKLDQTEVGPDLGIFKVRFDHLENPRNQKKFRVVVLESADAANVVAITKDKKVVMVRQLRFGIGKETIELPGGFVDAGEEDTQISAARELVEETGYVGEDWHYLGEIESNPAFMTSLVHHWLVKEVSIASTPDEDQDEGEYVEVICLTLDEIKENMKAGLIQHPHTLSALARVFPLWDYPEL